MLESKYQASLIDKLYRIFGKDKLTIQKNDEQYRQGFPDLTLYYGNRYACLEVKASATAKHRPNQDYYVDLINARGGFASFVYPENEKEVLRDIQRYFGGLL